jgi:hypothetical protein
MQVFGCQAGLGRWHGSETTSRRRMQPSSNFRGLPGLRRDKRSRMRRDDVASVPEHFIPAVAFCMDDAAVEHLRLRGARIRSGTRAVLLREPGLRPGISIDPISRAGRGVRPLRLPSFTGFGEMFWQIALALHKMRRAQRAPAVAGVTASNVPHHRTELAIDPGDDGYWVRVRHALHSPGLPVLPGSAARGCMRCFETAESGRPVPFLSIEVRRGAGLVRRSVTASDGRHARPIAR